MSCFRCAAAEPKSRSKSNVSEAHRHGSSCGEEHANVVRGECPRLCCATKELVSQGTAKVMARGAEPFTCFSRVLHRLRFVDFNIFSVLVIYPWIDGNAGPLRRMLYSFASFEQCTSQRHPHIVRKLLMSCFRWTACACVCVSSCARDLSWQQSFAGVHRHQRQQNRHGDGALPHRKRVFTVPS